MPSDDELVGPAVRYAPDLAVNCSPVAMARTTRQLQADWRTDPVAAGPRRARGHDGLDGFEMSGRAFVAIGRS